MSISKSKSSELYTELIEMINNRKPTQEDILMNITFTCELLGYGNKKYTQKDIDNLLFKNADYKVGDFTLFYLSLLGNPITYFFIMPRSKSSLIAYELNTANRFVNEYKPGKKYYKSKSSTSQSYIIIWEDYLRERVPMALIQTLSGVSKSQWLRDNILKYVNYGAIRDYYNMLLSANNHNYDQYINKCIIPYMKKYFTFEQCLGLSQICVMGKRALFNCEYNKYFIPDHIKKYIIDIYKPYPCAILFIIFILNVTIDLYGSKEKNETGIMNKQKYFSIDIIANDIQIYTGPVMHDSSGNSTSKRYSLSENYDKSFNKEIIYDNGETINYKIRFYWTDSFIDKELCYNIFNENINDATGKLMFDISDNLQYQQPICELIHNVLKKMLNVQYNDYHSDFASYYWMSPYDMCGVFNKPLLEIVHSFIAIEETTITLGMILFNANTFSNMNTTLDYGAIINSCPNMKNKVYKDN